MRRLALLFITLVSFYSFVTNAQSLYTIELQHRSASSLIPLIEPLLDGEDAISGQNTLLLLKTSNARYQELIAIIRQLDVRAKQLLIEIRSPRNLSGQNTQQKSKIVLSNRNNSHISHSSRNTISTQSNDPVRSIRVIDGYSASIEDGQLVPLLSESLRFGFGRANQGIALNYYKVATTITVTPRLHGNNVTLEITPHYSTLNHENYSEIRSQSSSTTVVVPLNKWTLLNAASQESKNENQSGLSTRSVNSETQVRVSVIAD
ncbi:MAG: hypothetical protein COC05_04685 [Gammaproteobacteria bacterium]|nr:MAG: hypothetical protein COC05_04685 [Gammaproteobacteria bacterium]